MDAISCTAWRRINSVISIEPIQTRRTSSMLMTCANARSCSGVHREGSADVSSFNDGRSSFRSRRSRSRASAKGALSLAAPFTSDNSLDIGTSIGMVANAALVSADAVSGGVMVAPDVLMVNQRPSA